MQNVSLYCLPNGDWLDLTQIVAIRYGKEETACETKFPPRCLIDYKVNAPYPGATACIVIDCASREQALKLMEVIGKTRNAVTYPYGNLT